MTRVIAGIVLTAGVLCGRENAFPLKPAAGSAEIQWVSPSTFRFARRFAGPAPVEDTRAEKVAVEVEDRGARLRFTTRYLTVDVDKDGGGISVQDVTNIRVRRGDGVTVIENSAGGGERFYGLGGRTAAKLDLRGTTIETKRPLLISSAGYGLFVRTQAACRFVLRESMRATVPGDAVEFFFYYGPAPKEIMEEHTKASGESENFGLAELKPRVSAGGGKGSWADLRNTIYSLQHESMSAMRVPSLDLGQFSAEVFPRAAQLGAFIPLLSVPEPCTSKSCEQLRRWRTRLTPYLRAYGYEANTRGIPVIHPLAMQYSKDADGARFTDELMVGDEFLIAPVFGAVESVRIYLPPGIWTDLRTNATYKGRQEVTVPVVFDALPMLARNGTIVPLASDVAGGPMELHYFPKLGAEFFFYEEEFSDVSQVHAAPSVDFLRLEIESLKNRGYEWVIHHTPECKKVMQGTSEYLRVDDATLLVGGTWYYDWAQQNLHVRVQAAARGDEIINIAF